VMSADSAITYTSVHSEARSWMYIPEPEHPEDLVPAEDEAPTPPLPPSFLAPRTPPLLPIPLPTPSTSRRADIPEADTPPRKRLLLTTPRPGCEVGESSAAAARESQDPLWPIESIIVMQTLWRPKDRAAMRAGIEVLRRERLAYEQESMENCQALQQGIRGTNYNALEAGAREDTLEDTGSSAYGYFSTIL
ncbi:hypothetical protein Tco_0028570, partial [Tanacetum coccineum]